MVWKESVCLTASIAKKSLACYSVEWLCAPKSGIKGLFSNVELFQVQHWPCCQWSMICATLKTTVNSELRKLDFSEFKTTGKLGINELRLGKYILNGHQTRNCKFGLFLELRPEDQWHHHDSSIWKQQKSRECQTLMTTFSHEGPLRHLPVQVSTAQQGPKMYCMMLYICQGDMYTIAKKVILSVCCVVRC